MTTPRCSERAEVLRIGSCCWCGLCTHMMGASGMKNGTFGFGMGVSMEVYMTMLMIEEQGRLCMMISLSTASFELLSRSCRRPSLCCLNGLYCAVYVRSCSGIVAAQLRRWPAAALEFRFRTPCDCAPAVC
jgi:hypothetical protein